MGLIEKFIYWLDDNRKSNTERLKDLMDFLKYDLNMKLELAEKSKNKSEITMLRKQIKRIKKDILKLKLILVTELDFYNEKIDFMKSNRQKIPNELMIKKGKIQRLLREDWE